MSDQLVAELQHALCNAIEHDGVIKLQDNLIFPVETHALNGDSLLVREAQRDLWDVTLNKLVRGTTIVLIFVGPTGCGKVYSISFIKYLQFLKIIFCC